VIGKERPQITPCLSPGLAEGYSMPVNIVVDVRDFYCFKEIVPKESMAASALARVESHYADSFPSCGEIVIVCEEQEALDLLAYAQKNFPVCFNTIREALRRANFYRKPAASLMFTKR
jgi:hypothetical protein